MNRTDHILWNIAEGCAEVAQRASKAARFGLEEKQEGQPYTNAERLLHEFADLIGSMDLLIDEEGIPEMEDFEERIERKKLRFEEYLGRSKAHGRLDEKPLAPPTDVL